MPGDDSEPGSAVPSSVTLPPRSSGLPRQEEGEQRIIDEGHQRRAEAGDPAGPLLRSYVDQARASASANNSPEPAWQAGDSEDVDTQPPRIMGNQSQPTQPSESEFFASLRAAHAAAEAEGAESAKLCDRLSAQENGDHSGGEHAHGSREGRTQGAECSSQGDI